MNKYVIAKCITGEEIKALRQTLNMTQREFAGFAGCSVPTVERWESGKKEITGPIVTLAELLKRDNEMYHNRCG